MAQEETVWLFWDENPEGLKVKADVRQLFFMFSTMSREREITVEYPSNGIMRREKIGPCQNLSG